LGAQFYCIKNTDSDSPRNGHNSRRDEQTPLYHQETDAQYAILLCMAAKR